MHAGLTIVPTYNEGKNVVETIRAVLALSEAFSLLVLGDNSSGGTAEIVCILQQETDHTGRLCLIVRPGKIGLGTACLASFERTLEHRYNYTLETDRDFSHPPSALPHLLRAASEEGHSVAVGFRYVRGGGVKDWPLNRIFMNYLTSVYVYLITWLPVQDTTAGFTYYRREVLEAIRLGEVHSRDYTFQIEMKYTVYCLGFKIKEVPITSVNRKFGSSKVNGLTFGGVFTGALKLHYW